MMGDHSRRDPERDSSQGVSNNRGILPLLHQPGNPPPHKITNFCIENILKPSFGRRATNRALDRAEQSGSTDERVPKSDKRRHEGKVVRAAAAAAAAAAASDSDPEDRPRHPDLGHEDREQQSRSSQADPAMLWPAWVYCTRYSDRPSSGPRSRKPKKPAAPAPAPWKEDKRPRTAFTGEQLHRLKTEFVKNQYLTDERRQTLSQELALNESQIKIWFQNKRAKMKKASGGAGNSLAQQLMAQGLYDHSTSKDHEHEHLSAGD